MIKGTKLSFDREITMGRGQQNKVVLDKKEVSKKHLRIFFDERQKCFILEDFGSANGTHLDDIRVEGKEQLRHLNVISIAGVYDFIFQDIELCKTRHPNQNQKAPILKQRSKPVVQENTSVTPPKLGKGEKHSIPDHSQTVVAGEPFSLPPDLKKTQKKSEQNLSETILGKDAFILPPELGKTKEPSASDHSQTIVAGGPFSLPSKLGKTPKKSEEKLSETVVGEGAFILPPERGKTKQETVPDHSKIVVSESPFSLPPDLGKTPKKSSEENPQTVIGQGAFSLPPNFEQKNANEAKTGFLQRKGEPVRVNKADQVLPQKLPQPKQSFFLEVWIDGTDTRRFRLKEGENMIGRKSPAHIIIEKIEISRRHAILTLKNESVYLKDAGSKNKTFVDGQEINESLEIQPGHELRFGLIKARVIAE